MPTSSVPLEIPPRLPFVLPAFTRVSWADESARKAWEPKLARINQAWSYVEWASAAAGLRRCALLWRSREQRDQHVGHWRQQRLSALSLGLAPGGSAQASASTGRLLPGAASRRLTITVVGPQAGDLQAFREAWLSRDHDAIGRLLGYPCCCRGAFAAFWRSGGTDPTWMMACTTDEVQRSGNTVTVTGSDNANILWRWLGLRAVAHLPCSFACPETAQIGERMLALGHEAGFVQEMESLCEVLSWSAEYSALHGIAEIKTPILRVATRTDATAEKYVVRRPGTGYPEGSPPGLRFPYRAPVPLTLRRRQARTSGPPSPASRNKDWYFRDNGFGSLQLMTSAHQPLAKLAAQVLGSQAGNVLDLGSGNGALLAAVSGHCPGVQPFGVDVSPEAVAHAPAVLQGLPEEQASAGEVGLGDFFDSSTWRHRHYAMAILMLGRLLEREKDAGQFLRALSRRCDVLLAYLYADWEHFSLNDLAAQYGLTVDPALRIRTPHVQAGVIRLSSVRSPDRVTA